VTAADRALPATATEVSDLVARCNATDRKLLIVGGDTLHGMGFPPERADVRLVTAALSAVAEYEPADLTIAVQGGLPLQTLNNVLARQRQFVPFDSTLEQKS